jgi:ureidoacrylate peracid hydrolase
MRNTLGEPHPGDVVTAEHWCSSGFANTNLDMQLKKYGIHRVIVMGLIAHTCVDATVRYSSELGYEVTVVKDATASYSDEHMRGSLEVNLPNHAGAVVSTDEIVAALASSGDVDVASRSRTAGAPENARLASLITEATRHTTGP